jgi:hypothetical protein
MLYVALSLLIIYNVCMEIKQWSLVENGFLNKLALTCVNCFYNDLSYEIKDHYNESTHLI